LWGPQQGVWLARLEAEHPNLRTALTWSLQAGEGATGLRLAGALWQFWVVRGHYSEGRGWLEEILARSGEAAAAVRAKALRGADALARRQGDYGRATVLYEEALALHRHLGETRGIASALKALGDVACERLALAAYRAANI